MADETNTPQTDPLDAHKTALRHAARATRNAIPAGQRAADAERLAQLGLPPGLAAAGVISGYDPTSREFDCRPLLRRLAAEGWTLAMPVVMGDAPLLFRRWRFGDPLIRGQRGIREPASGAVLRPDVLLIPLLAFDASGFRLGYGGGHYDRTLDALRRWGQAIAIGVAFAEQEVAQLPVGPYDQRLDWILTPSGPRRFPE